MHRMYEEIISFLQRTQLQVRLIPAGRLSEFLDQVQREVKPRFRIVGSPDYTHGRMSLIWDFSATEPRLTQLNRILRVCYFPCNWFRGPYCTFLDENIAFSFETVTTRVDEVYRQAIMLILFLGEIKRRGYLERPVPQAISDPGPAPEQPDPLHL
jgi:hypothetical protein